MEIDTGQLSPLLGGLFSEERETSDSSEEDDYSESDREWRDAVKAAVESEIQYQVQLRLSLESPVRKPERYTKKDNSLNDDNTSSRPRRETCRTVVTPQDACETVPQEDTKTMEDENELDKVSVSHDKTRSQFTLGSINNQNKVEVIINKPAVKRKQTVYDYLQEKYGTPADQLQSLVSKGRFLCNTRELNKAIGVDERVRWPVECKITLPSPNLSPLGILGRGLDQCSVPFFPDGPILGHARPSFHRQPDKCTTVFDKSRDIVSTGEGLLKFESRFESGNLQQAIKVGEFEYDLLLSTDLYTERHTQWFYFQTSGMAKGVSYIFNIINFRKRSSLYNNGMKILMHSELDGKWSRTGRNICYKKLPPCCHTPILKQGTEYYYLSWTMELPHDNDVCIFAHCYPYTYSRLLKQLDSYEMNEQRRKCIKKEVLCETLAGNDCHILTITDFGTPKEDVADKMGVVFSARVHPGETNSSWMAEGMLDFLTSEHKHAKYLRSRFVFKIIPMLNPDGVVVGNYRTSLSGVDLNRVYKNPMEKVFPTIAAAKKLIKEFNEERKVILYVDLHGHSRNYNVFMYGCHTPQCTHQEFLEERAVPWMLSQISKEKFSFRKCKFAVQRCKEATGRVALWREGIANSFTMEASFCGTNMTSPTPLHFTTDDLKSVGRDLCEVVLKLQRYNKSNRFKVNARIAEYLMKSINDTVPQQKGDIDLPDIVMSTRNRNQSENDKGEDGSQVSRKNRKQLSKTLHRFQSISLKRLEVESSTSGSDSEDDDFKYCKGTKTRSKQKLKKAKHLSRHSMAAAIHGLKPTTDQKQLKTFIHLHSEKNSSDSIVLPHQSKPNAESDKASQHSLISSAPARLQGGGSTHVAGHGWRFVNRYSNRSNGGIPIFSEERLKERAERKKLKSTSLIQSSTVAQLPTLASSSITPTLLFNTGKLGGSGEVTASSHLPSLIWKPNDSQKETIPVMSWGNANGSHFSNNDMANNWSHNSNLESNSLGGMFSKRHMRTYTCNDVAGSSSVMEDNTTKFQHYRRVKRIVESQRKMPAGGVMIRPSNPARGGPISRGPLPPSLPTGLPPKLCQYISEIWQKHSGNL